MRSKIRGSGKKRLSPRDVMYIQRTLHVTVAGDKTVMFPVLLAAFVLSSGATGLSSLWCMESDETIKMLWKTTKVALKRVGYKGAIAGTSTKIKEGCLPKPNFFKLRHMTHDALLIDNSNYEGFALLCFGVFNTVSGHRIASLPGFPIDCDSLSHPIKNFLSEPSTEEALKGRSYSNDGYRANNFAVPSPPPVPGTRSLYSNPYLTNGYNGGDTSFQNRDSNSYRDSSMYDRNSNPYVSDYRTTNNEGYFQPQSKNTYSFAQDRFHPTTFDVDSHKGEIILPPLDTDNVVQDTVGSSSDVQSFFLRPSNNFVTQPVGQGSDVSTVQDPSPSSSVQEQQFAYQIPLPNYDYQPPPPAQTPYYYYQPPSPPSNLYLPEPSPPPPPPPPPEDEREVNYTYYYLGPKLWYIPLLFSVYYVIYVGVLIVKSIARHKLLFPININNAASSLAGRRGRDLEEITARVTRALATAALKYLRQTNISKVAEKTKHNT
ncbi:hypothetical protein J6590_070447 [Homalodisca vitripennis]|nr:hypothetical protein J6590_070447 [Homalodisca vitripennis]